MSNLIRILRNRWQQRSSVTQSEQLPDDALADTTSVCLTSVPEEQIAPVGYVRERSTRHVAGFMYAADDTRRRLQFAVILPEPDGERIIARSLASDYDTVLAILGLDDAFHGFRVIFPEPLTEAERDRLIVRAIGSAMPLPLAPELRDRYEPIKFVAMDIVDNCNLRCPFCLYDYGETHRTHFMSDEVFDAALRLLPYVGPEFFWLSCLHEPTLHPGFERFIERIPQEYRNNIFFTTNLAKRMPDAYFDLLARSGLHHINVSIESLDPDIYERMRKGARHRIFMDNWDRLLAAFNRAPAPPQLRYITMAYRSNLREIPELIAFLREERKAWNVEVRYTYDKAHIPEPFKKAELLDGDEWRWLQSELTHYPPHEVLLCLPPEHSGRPAVDADVSPSMEPSANTDNGITRLSGEPTAKVDKPVEPAGAPSSWSTVAEDTTIGRMQPPDLVEIQMTYDGTMTISKALPSDSQAGRTSRFTRNILDVDDPLSLVDHWRTAR